DSLARMCDNTKERRGNIPHFHGVFDIAPIFLYHWDVPNHYCDGDDNTFRDVHTVQSGHKFANLCCPYQKAAHHTTWEHFSDKIRKSCKHEPQGPGKIQIA